MKLRFPHNVPLKKKKMNGNLNGHAHGITSPLTTTLQSSQPVTWLYCFFIVVL